MSNARQSTPDFPTLRRIASGMSMEALVWSAKDARDAARMADTLEAEGCRIQKTGGYYIDEAGVYQSEIRKREDEIAKARRVERKEIDTERGKIRAACLAGNMDMVEDVHPTLYNAVLDFCLGSN